MGNVRIPLAALMRALGAEPVLPPPFDAAVMAEGIRLSPELICIPFKLTLGSVKQALEMGADTILYGSGVWSCRYGYYPRLAEDILHDLGFRFKVITTHTGELNELLKSVVKLSYGNPAVAASRVARALRIGWLKSSAVDAVERLSYDLRPLERRHGATTRVANSVLRRIDETDSPGELVKLRKSIPGEFEAIDVDRTRTPLRIRVLGESFCVLEPFINQNALERLGEMGVRVEPYLTTHRWLGFHSLRIGERRRRQLLQPARRYWRYNVGGEDENVVAYLLDAARRGYDGALHLHPFACMPGTVVGPTLSRISREHDIPLLDISLDEQTSDAGFYTRVEAFLSVLEKRRKRRSERRHSGFVVL
jgi:predicted nucleotide-binding protein (sugar kinase/HSP70/actin superfamily)